MSLFNLSVALYPSLKLLTQVYDGPSLRADADESEAVRQALIWVNDFHDVWNPARELPRESGRG